MHKPQVKRVQVEAVVDVKVDVELRVRCSTI